MQICMKLDQQSRKNLRDRIKARLSETGLKIIQIARAADIDPGQASRICRGDFRTMSNSVMQICNILEIDVTAHVRSEDRLDGRLVARLIDLWDGTPEDSARLSQLLAQLAKLRRSKCPDSEPSRQGRTKLPVARHRARQKLKAGALQR